MGIKLVWGLDKDRRPDLNKDDSKARYYITPIVRINFIDEATGRVMFSFVPTLKHEEDLKQAFTLLKTYDSLRTTMVDFIMENQIKQHNKPILEIKGECKAGDIQQQGFIKANGLDGGL